MSGSNNNTITLTYSENTVSENRTCKIIVHGQSVSDTIYISQEAIAHYLFTSQDTVILGPNTGSSDQIDVTSNTSWNITKYPTWIDLTPDFGYGNGHFNVYTNSINPLPVDRMGVLTISSTAGNRDLIIIQQYPNGIEDYSSNERFSLYPSPAKNIIYTTLNTVSSGLFDIEIYNSLGQLVQHNYALYSNNINISINITTIPAGAYVINIHNRELSYRKKFIKTE
jgi:hypothetical protein